MQQLLKRFEDGEDVLEEIVQHAIEATPFIEKALQQVEDNMKIRLLTEVVAKLPFYVGLVLHQTIVELAERADAVGNAARDALVALEP